MATPVSSAGADTNYLRTLVRAILHKFPDMELDFAGCDTGHVNFARNELAWEAESRGFDRILFVDDDMAVEPHHIVRLLSHDVPLVAGVYCRRRPGKPHWFFVPKKGAERREDGLLECVRVATGFESVSVKHLAALRRYFPEREFIVPSPNGGAPEVRCEFFPMGVWGPRTADSRLERVKAALNSDLTSEERLARIQAACYDEQPPGVLMGEDYAFASMMRKAGFPVYVDLDLAVIPHIGKAQFPITPEMVGFGPGIVHAMPEAQEN